MKKYELTQYEFVKVRVDHKPFSLYPRFMHDKVLDKALVRAGPGNISEVNLNFQVRNPSILAIGIFSR